MSNTARQLIERLHALYVQLTGLAIPLDMQRETIWFEWQRRGHGEQELRDVVAHLRRGIREQRRNPGALKFRNLIGQPDYFEEDLAEARAAQRAFRARPQGDKRSVLKTAGRDTSPKGAAKSAAEIVAGEGFKQFVNLKKTIR